MKAKFSLDKAKLKQFFVNHGEKVGLAVGALLAVYALYSAYLLQPYPKKADDLALDVKLARDNLNTSDKKRMKLEVDGVKLPPEGFSPIIDRELIAAVNPARFKEEEWNKPLFETKQRRREPQYLALRDLRVNFYYSAVTMKDGEASVPLGEEWITVTGLVPLEEQTAAYSAAFANALDVSTNASPVYPLYEIRRAELTSLDPNEAVDWNKIAPLNLQSEVDGQMERWLEVGPEYIDPYYVRVPLTEPLPPLTNKDYGDWSRHPEIPVAPPPDANAPAPTPVAPKAGLFGGANAGAAPPPPPPPAPVANAAVKQPPKFLMFRFLDFNIESGKRYRYQVRLILSNPNYNLDQAHLESPELAQGETRLAPWSIPSPTAEVPYLDKLIAGGIKPLGGDNEPTVSVAAKQWFPTLAATGFVRFDTLLRGATLDNPNATVTHRKPGDGTGMKSPFDFKSGVILVDFAWERTDARLKGPNERVVEHPSEVLLLNPRGQLVICTQTADQPVWDEDRNIQANVGAAGAAGTGMGGPPAGGPTPPVGTPPGSPPKKSIFDVK